MVFSLANVNKTIVSYYTVLLPYYQLFDYHSVIAVLFLPHQVGRPFGHAFIEIINSSAGVYGAVCSGTGDVKLNKAWCLHRGGYSLYWGRPKGRDDYCRAWERWERDLRWRCGALQRDIWVRTETGSQGRLPEEVRFEPRRILWCQLKHRPTEIIFYYKGSISDFAGNKIFSKDGNIAV